jgi:uracil-DNA glycosylase
MKQTIDIEEIKLKLSQKLEPSGWALKLRGFIYSTEFDQCIKELAQRADIGKRFTPTLGKIFRAFEECPVDKLKIVIVGQDPYPTVGVADGIAFSCSKSQKEQPSLRFILDEVEKMYPMGYERPLDLTKWTRQGILLLNTALTTEVGKIGEHYEIWKPFITYLFDYLNNYNTGLVYIFMGKQAHSWAEDINDNNYKFFVSHPASAVYQKAQQWDSKGVFAETNKIMENLYGEVIIW